MQGTDAAAVAERFLARLGTALGADAGWIHGRRSDASFILLASWQLPKALAAHGQAALTWSPCWCQHQLDQGVVATGRRVETCERLDQGPGQASALSWHLSGTLLSLGRPVGLLSLAFAEERLVTPLEAATVRRVSALLGAIVDDTALLAPSTPRRTDRTDALSSFSARLLGLEQPGDIAQALVQMLTPVLPADFVAVYTPDEETQSLSIGVGHQWPQALGEIKLATAHDAIATAARGTETLLLPSIAAAPWPVPAALAKAGAQSLLVSPIRMAGQLLGVVAAAARPPVAYGSSEATLLTLASEQTALALAGAYARARTLQQLTQLTALQVESERRQEALWNGYTATLAALGDALGLRDPGTMGHSDRAVRIALALGRRLGLGREDLLHLEWGAHLHDIGKIGVPDAILSKPGPLTHEERQVMQAHPTLGYRMLSHLDFLGKSLDVVRCHHERYDGTGYPEGIAAENIPLLARIFSVADSYDAMTSIRPYRHPLTHQDAVAELVREQGRQFDPGVVEAFLRLSEAELTSGEPALETGAPALPQPESVQRHILSRLEPGALTEALFSVTPGEGSLQGLLDVILKSLEELFLTELGSILLLDEQGKELYVACQRGYTRQLIGELRVEVQGNRGVVAWVARNGLPYYVPNVLSDPIYVMGNPEVRSELALPIIVDGRVTGVLNIESRKVDAFPPPVRSMLEVFSGLVSLIIYRHQREEEIRRLALTDQATGLANRQALLDQLDRDTAQAVRGRRSFSVLLFHISDLARVRDLFGAAAAERLLAEVGQSLRAHCRRGDFPARWDDDTMAVIAGGARERSAHALALRLQDAIGHGPLATDFDLTVSVGLATFPTSGRKSTLLVSGAEQALREALAEAPGSIRSVAPDGGSPPSAG